MTQRLLLKLQHAKLQQRILRAPDVSAYVRRMLSNEVTELWRRRRAEAHALESWFVQRGSEHADEDGELDGELPAYLRGLAPEDRELLALRFWGNLSVQEVATRLGLGYSATAVRYFRLFRELRRRLPPAVGGGEPPAAGFR